MRRVFKGLIRRLYWYYLAARFYRINIDKWHFKNNYHSREYKKFIVENISYIDAELIIELGCGIGEIIGRISHTNKVGIDLDPLAIHVARTLFPRTSFEVNDFTSLKSTAKNAVLIMVNWIHNIEEKELKYFIENLIDLPSLIVVDAIEKNVQGYKYSHKFMWLDSHYEREVHRGFDDGNRSIILFRLK